MKCQLCGVDKEIFPVKATQATIHGPKQTTFYICQECLELSHQAYLDKEFLLVKGGTGGKGH
ncbi:MAG: hypothetical protein JW986_08050 [Methanotrichaceae archaeon]|nr:hypothetical protein [Methanotrichaceae archaeon]